MAALSILTFSIISITSSWGGAVQFTGCSIDVCTHGDNTNNLEISNDGGSTWTSLASESSWPTSLSYTYTGILSTNTRLRTTVKDVGVVGGFVGSFILKGSGSQQTYTTSNPITNSFDVTDSKGDSNYVYSALGTGAWGSGFLSGSCLNQKLGMQWVWNGQTYNTMTFTLNFADKIDVLQDLCKPVVEYRGCSIDVCTHGDNTNDLEVSNDGGATWTSLASESSWPTSLSYTYNGPLSSLTRLRTTVKDVGVVGGFVGSFELSGAGSYTWTTSNSITNSFDVTDSNGVTNYVYSALGTGAWGSGFLKGSCLNQELGMQWVWNGQTYNTMTFTLNFEEKENYLKKICQPVTYRGCSIDVCTHGDNTNDLEISNDGGSTWTSLASEGSWPTSLSFTYNGLLSANTRLRTTVKDVGVVGGFVGSFELSGSGSKTWITESPITDSFDVTDSNGISNYVYSALGTGAWGSGFLARSCLNQDLGMKWVWNGPTYNTMTYTLNFQDKIGYLQEFCEVTPLEYNKCSIEVCSHGDNSNLLEISSDGGSTWTQLATESSWPTSLSYTYNGVISTETRLRTTVKDVGVVGGFVGSFILKGSGSQQTWITSNPITDSFDVTDSKGISNYVYSALGTGAWGSGFLARSCLNQALGMQWVWNGQTYNTMTFTLNFEDKEDYLQELCQPLKSSVVAPNPSEGINNIDDNDNLNDIDDNDNIDFNDNNDNNDNIDDNDNIDNNDNIYDIDNNNKGFNYDHDHNYSYKNGENDIEFRNSVYDMMRNLNDNIRYNNNIMYLFIAVNLITIIAVIWACLSFKSRNKNKGYIPTVQYSEDEVMIRT